MHLRPQIRILTMVFAAAIMSCTQPALGRVLTGKIADSAYRIDIPDSGWNGQLVIYCHGFTLAPTTADQMSPSEMLSSLFAKGFAIAQPGYSSAGWNVNERLTETEALRSYFDLHVSHPSQTFLIGESLGGFLVPMLLEKEKTPYAAGLALCAPLSSADSFVVLRMVAVRSVFDFYYPNVLPRLDADSTEGGGEDLFAKVTALLKSHPSQSSEVRHYAGIRTDEELAGAIEIYTYILADIRRRAGGNPYDNRGSIYDGTSDNVALNRGVIRYAPDLHALQYLESFKLSGSLQAPLLTLSPSYDPFIPSWSGDLYAVSVDEAGSGERLVREVTSDVGHCHIASSTVIAGFSDLVRWKASGVRPSR